MTRTREQVAAYQRAWRARHPERARFHRARWRARYRLREKLKRTRASGRVCRACGETDRGRAWSGSPDLCSACHVRGLRNGFCRTCGEARFTRSQRLLGDIDGERRFVWVLRNRRPLRSPIPVKGRQGLWTPPPALVADIATTRFGAPA